MHPSSDSQITHILRTSQETTPVGFSPKSRVLTTVHDRHCSRNSY